MVTVEQVMKMGPVIPVLAFKSAEEAVGVCRALYEAGIRVFEITLRHESALDAIKAVKADLPDDAIVGAGTVLSPELAKAAVDAGCAFGVSPGLTPALAEAVKALNFPFLPGVATISEAMQAREWGFTALKFFPASVSGGPAFLKAVHSVLPDLIFCPTGGIKAGTAADYRAVPSVVTVGGSWLTPRSSDGSIDLTTVKELAAEALSASDDR